MKIKRDIHLNRIIASSHNGLIKVVTGIRRCRVNHHLYKDKYDENLYYCPHL